MKQEVQNALNVLKQVAAQYRGNLQEHQQIQAALLVVENELNPDSGKKPE